MAIENLVNKPTQTPNISEIQVEEANTTNRRGVLGIYGISGSGKTTSLLVLAHGIVAARHPELMGNVRKDNKGRYTDFSNVSHLIGVIDTEHSRSGMSANRVYHSNDYTYKLGSPKVVNLGAPYTNDRIINAKNKLKEVGCEIIILDSASHYWKYLTELHDKLTAASASKNSYSSWGVVKQQWSLFVEKMFFDPSVDIFMAMRQKADVVMTENEKGKQTPKKVGTKADMKDDITFEFQVSLELDHKSHKVIVDKDNTRIFNSGDMIDPSYGTYFAQWMDGSLSDYQILLWKIKKLINEHGSDKVGNFKTDFLEKNKYEPKTTIKQMDEIMLMDFVAYVEDSLGSRIEME